MRHVEDQEELQWLGGEAQVHPYNSGQSSVSRKRLISGAMLLLAGVGLGRLGAVGILKREHGKQRNHTGNVIADVPSKGSAIMEQTRTDERLVRDRAGDTVGVVTVWAAFVLGLFAGTVATLLTTPESGLSVRNRLKRGLETARKELDEVVGEAKEDWTTVSDEICDAMKRTASRVKQAAEVTKDALTSRDASARRMP